MEKESYFKTSLDKKNATMSWVVGFIMVASVMPAIVLPLMLTQDETIPTLTSQIVVSVLVMLILPVVALFAPRGCAISGTHLIISRPLLPVLIPLNDVREVAPTSLTGVWRTCGCGGFLGGWGWMRCRELGSFRGYLTKADGFVLISLRNGAHIVVTPDDPEGFVEAMKGWVMGNG